jgi:hypothetical protein
MKLSLLAFDDVITVPGGRLSGERDRADVSEQTFTEADGWDLHEVSQGRFTLQSACMPEAMTIGGYGYRYLPMPSTPPLPSRDVTLDQGLQNVVNSMASAFGVTPSANVPAKASLPSPDEVRRMRKGSK